MKKTRIPTIVGLMLVCGAVFVFSYVFDRVTPLLSRASPSIAPVNVMISNVTDTSFSVSWTTPTSATGALAISPDGGTKYTEFDERDQLLSPTNTQHAQGKYFTHMVTVRSAKPNITYHTRIVSNGNIFGDGVKPFDITTAPTLSSSGTTLEPAFGTVTKPDGTPAEGALVYVTLENAQVLSTFVKSSGAWVIPLHLARTENYQSFIVASDRLSESIIVRSQDGETTAVTDTLNDNPVPAMVMGKNYDFRKIQAQKPPTDTPSAPLAQAQPSVSAATKPDVLGATSSALNGVIAFLQPKNGAALPSNLPQISGTGVPGHIVQLIIGLTRPLVDTTTIGADGLWRYTPKSTLDAGKQSITMTTTDIRGKATAITHTFEILKSGTQVLGDATPSATLAPTADPTLGPTAMPTIDVTPTSIATLAGESIPTTGSPVPLLLLLMAGGALLTSGIILLRQIES